MRCARRLLPAACALAALAPARAAQSVHAAASAAAESIHVFGIAMYAGAAVIALCVLVLVLKALASPGRETSSTLFVLGGGGVLPVAVLSVLLVSALLLDNRLSQPLGPPAARIQVIGHQWWWEVRYLPPANPTDELARLLQRLSAAPANPRRGASEQAGEPQPIVTANEIRIPVGHAVEIEVRTRDVIHSLWVPALGGKVDTIPGRVSRLAWRAERAGVYRGQCAEFCGGPHGLMGLVVVADPVDAYRAWLQREASVSSKPSTPRLRRGQRVFLDRGCGECHAIRGTAARGTAGPDLTHVGSRRTLAAATIDNHADTLAAWIADPQRFKPGNRMPRDAELSGSELEVLAAYLASLD